MPVIQKKSEDVVKSGKYQQFYLEKQMLSKGIETQSAHVDLKAERREERRRKAASGKGGGGTQGRETKTKAVKKHTRSTKHANHDSDSEEDTVTTKKSHGTIEIITIGDVKNGIKTTLENEGLDDLVSEIAHFLQKLVI